MKYWFTFFVVMSFSFTAVAQAPEASDSTYVQEPQKEKKPKANYKKVFLGGGIGLGISSNSGSINISPMVGYNVTKNLQTAVRFTYWYQWGRAWDARGRQHNYSGNIYATSVFARYVLFKGLFAHVEPEWMNLPTYYWKANSISPVEYELVEERVDAFNFYLGGGFYQGFSGNSGAFFMILYNLNETENSFYSNPYFQVGFAVGI
ncbi:hypothetical protein KFE98_10865 [bacterium SCSIO 12741]|nr:hypothetical protein KFE98_10865 [bacterium SCSIO 12741]